jgi:uncharacterized membrane protein HdeD (DUF308 family)
MLVLRGVIAIIFGILAILVPEITLGALVLLVGAYVLVDGVFSLWTSLSTREGNREWWVGLLEGVAGIAIGVITLIWPEITGLILLYLIAIWALGTGILEIYAAYVLRQELNHEWLLALSGVLSMIFGGLLILFPGGGAVAVIWLIGLYALLFGGTLVALGFRLRTISETAVSTG